MQTEYEEPSEQSDLESRMLSGDLNVADVEWIVQYRIADAYKYVFHVRNVRRDPARPGREQHAQGGRRPLASARCSRSAARRSRPQAKETLQQSCDRYGTGIHIEQLVLQDVNPPKPVRDSFNEVNQAIQERERAVNQAWAQYNSVIPKARGSAAQTVQGGGGLRAERVNRAQRRSGALPRRCRPSTRRRPRSRARGCTSRPWPRWCRAREQRMFIDDRLKGLVPLFSLNRGSGAAERGGEAMSRLVTSRSW